MYTKKEKKKYAFNSGLLITAKLNRTGNSL